MLGCLTRIQHPDPQGDIRYHYNGTGAAHGAGIGRLTRIEGRHSRIDYLDKHWVIALDSAERSVNNTSSQTAIQISGSTATTCSPPVQPRMPIRI